MTDNSRPPTVDPVAFERLQKEATDLRLQIAGEVGTSRLVVHDAGVARARIAAESGGRCRLVLLDEDGFERTGLKALDQVGAVEVAARARNGEASRVELVADHSADGDDCVVGLYLFGRGDELAGFHVSEEHQADAWIEPS